MRGTGRGKIEQDETQEVAKEAIAEAAISGARQVEVADAATLEEGALISAFRQVEIEQGIVVAVEDEGQARYRRTCPLTSWYPRVNTSGR